ncbi:N-acyl-L-amino-acid amidohydrolase [Oesophagostomum dentatum]|uniref:N-acyl-L-amino-acid amidohydrolase n=1 Tax=Oesophagostomum dentatum TaxID=61180 RepID=A0A0B1TLQ9_OESDE|nr:N-acyl-L-amino-acid amidohydrolase [Oesophagostomum dentatum]
MAEDIAVTKFREYLRVKSEQPNPDYAACQKFLFGLADELGIARKAVETVPGKPVIIMTIPGSEPSLPSLVLYSHTDVVPTYKDQWKYDPYSAHKDEHGNIYGRDEEIGATDGMQKFVNMPEFRELNLGFMLDEGLATEGSAYKGLVQTLSSLGLEITCTGSPGHGSKFQSIINSALAFREEQRAILKSDPSKRLGDVITVNLTKVEGGVMVNILPEKFTLLLDIRLPPNADFKEMDKRLADWCKKAGPGVTCRFLIKNEFLNVTSTAGDDPFWAAFVKSMKDE